MSYDIPHACYVPHDSDVFGFGSIVDEFEKTLGSFDDDQFGGNLYKCRLRLEGDGETDASYRDRETRTGDVND